MIELLFHTDSAGSFRDVLTFCSDSDSSRISVQLPVSAEVRQSVGRTEKSAAALRLHPNPVSDFLEISSDIDIVMLELYDIRGQHILSVEKPGSGFSISLESVEQGIYILNVKYQDGTNARSRILIVP